MLEKHFKCRECRAVVEGPGDHSGCVGLVEEVETVPVDIAWRRVDGRYNVRLLFVDHPSLGLAFQLKDIPLRHLGAPLVQVVFKSTDPDSRYDPRAHRWLAKGPRHQALERAFTADAANDAFPFHRTAKVIEVLPDLQLHVVRSGAPVPAWEAVQPWKGKSKYAGRNKQVQGEKQHEHARASVAAGNTERAQPNARVVAALAKPSPVAERVIPREQPVIQPARDEGGGGRRR